MQERLIGSRIRERRMAQKIRQADLAASAGISASYLNLIEHDKRRIGGKLLVDIAQVLDVEPSLLSEGAEAALIAALREAAVISDDAKPELDKIDEFAARFPGWAKLVRAQHRASVRLERTIETLGDRLTHDPEVAAAMHEVLSMVTAVQATAGILHENKELEPEWRARFHRNLSEDSERLASSSQALVAYFDGDQNEDASMASPRDAVHLFLRKSGYHFDPLEKGGSIDVILNSAEELQTDAAKDLARDLLTNYQRLATAMPFNRFVNAHQNTGGDLVELSKFFGVSLTAAMHRAAFLPEGALDVSYGLVVCDMAGSILVRKEVKGFNLPRYSAGCPKWPVFRALQTPGQPISQEVQFVAQNSENFACYAVATPQGVPKFNQPTTFSATMLIRPIEDSRSDLRRVGAACRICSVSDCAARREASVLAGSI